MGGFAIFEILSNFVQYIGIVGSVKVSWPSELAWVGNYLRYLRIDFTVPLPNVTIPPLDFRAQHIFLTNVVPLAFAALLLIFFKSLRIVLWCSALLFAIGLIFAGIVLLALPTSQFSSQVSIAQYLLIGGFLGLALLAAIYFAPRLYARYRKRKRQTIMPITESQELRATPVMEAWAADPDEDAGDDGNDDPLASGALDVNRIKSKNRAGKKSFWRQTRNFVVGFGLTTFGLIITGAFKNGWLSSEFNYYSAFESALLSIGSPIGWVMFGFGVALLYNWLSGLSARMRRFNTRVNYLFRKNVVKVVLFVLGIFYIPMATSILSVFMCVWVTAPAGNEFVLRTVSLDWSSLLSSFSRSTTTGVAYTACNFRANECPIANDLCPQSTDLRLAADVSFSCLKEIYPFYLPGALFAVVTVIVGIPWLYYRLIAVSARFIRELPASTDDPDLKWREQCMLTNSSCKSLFLGFELKWKYYKLVLLLHKIIIVSVFIFADKNSFAVICVLTASHSLFALLSLYSRPYIKLYEDVLATLCLLVNVGNAIVTLFVALGYTIPTWATILVPGLNIAAPSLVLAFGFYMQYREWKRKKAEAAAEAAASADASTDPITARQAKLKTKQPDLAATLSRADLEFIDSLDQDLDQRLLRTLVNSFLGLGLGAFLALAISAIGLMQAVSSNDLVRARAVDTGTAIAAPVAYEFAGYASWAEFTANCCCEAALASSGGVPVNVTASASVLEKWKCRTSAGKFIYKQRMRQYDGENGWSVRGYCATSFASAVTALPSLDAGSGLVKVGVSGNVTDYVVAYLW
ncbi:hypothetical protein AMAG_07789 [Allomyces macrogynus ATCC 38327]|uniref:TRP C-terminal domain-containing protein n=1 Tax=Allomyces macrogynus (strain ATCC 38327) TaxID=578462 RepID=A0A0L0SJC1_ALLM3|nr:hypothetical protein AMAG_07789 [Allomyces macrogynus ATCC 38327]|eukprot:KNE62587.1 hypothetical protein AMAG_07789 [Allomyces macrogynus ATCC 38327]